MVDIKGTEEITHKGQEGTAFEVATVALNKSAAKGRATGSMMVRFPAKSRGIEALSSEKEGSDIPAARVYRVRVFVPHKN